ncbi:MAG TPA: hypothetical protein VEA40_19880 [Ramlibacter sp.]|nr:hypothetical protein [Ramlibacter sp.]
MASILFPIHNLFAPLGGIADWLFSKPAPTARVAPRPASPLPSQPAVRASSVVRPKAKPLRVVRVFDGPRMPQAAGRMVISGRMADVCAELERLAALEARQ